MMVMERKLKSVGSWIKHYVWRCHGAIKLKFGCFGKVTVIPEYFRNIADQRHARKFIRSMEVDGAVLSDA